MFDVVLCLFIPPPDESSGELPEQSLPQFSAQFLRHPDDVRVDTKAEPSKTPVEKGHLRPHYGLHLP